MFMKSIIIIVITTSYVNVLFESCRLLTTKSWRARGATDQPAFMGCCPTISQTYLPFPPSYELVPVFYAPL